MRPTGRLVIAIILPAIVFQASEVTAQPTRADYDRATGLRDAYQALVTNVPEPAVWIGETSRFWYRRSVAGGHEFVMMDAATEQRRQPARR
jgi:hypothetical protein